VTSDATVDRMKNIVTFCTSIDFSHEHVELKLQQVIPTLPSLEDAEIIMWIRSTWWRAAELPSWQMLHTRAREVLTMRNGVTRATQQLRGLNVPRRDIMYFNTGNLPQD
jgi:hypothetical protein